MVGEGPRAWKTGRSRPCWNVISWLDFGTGAGAVRTDSRSPASKLSHGGATFVLHQTRRSAEYRGRAHEQTVNKEMATCACRLVEGSGQRDRRREKCAKMPRLRLCPQEIFPPWRNQKGGSAEWAVGDERNIAILSYGQGLDNPCEHFVCASLAAVAGQVGGRALPC